VLQGFPWARGNCREVAGSRWNTPALRQNSVPLYNPVTASSVYECWRNSFNSAAKETLPAGDFDVQVASRSRGRQVERAREVAEGPAASRRHSLIARLQAGQHRKIEPPRDETQDRRRVIRRMIDKAFPSEGRNDQRRNSAPRPPAVRFRRRDMIPETARQRFCDAPRLPRAMRRKRVGNGSNIEKRHRALVALGLTVSVQAKSEGSRTSRLTRTQCEPGRVFDF